MRTYEAYYSAAEYSQSMDVDVTLTLQDDGNYEYGEYWHEPAGSAGFSVKGYWYKSEEGIVLAIVDSTNTYSWKEGERVNAVIEGDELKIENGYKLRLKT